MRSSRIPAIVVCLFFALVQAAGAQEVDTPAGGLGVGVALKWIYAYTAKDNSTRTPGLEQFNTALVDLYLTGVLNDNIYYDIELGAIYNSDKRTGALFNGVQSQGEVSSIGVRQAKIRLPELIPYTTIEAGTFIPPITNYMPRKVQDLDLIHYPLLNAGAFYNTGLYGNMPIGDPSDVYPTITADRDFSIWQQTGFNVSVKPFDQLKIDVGMWNGIMPPYSPTNFKWDSAPATSVVLTVVPVEYLSLSLAYWGEEFVWRTGEGIAGPGDHNHTGQLNMWFLYASFVQENLEIYVDWAAGSVPDFQYDYTYDLLTGATTGTQVEDLRWQSWQATVGYWIVPEVEALIRWELIDPNTINDIKFVQSNYDRVEWITFGLNWRIKEQLELSANYIVKNEQGWFIEKKDAGQDPTIPGYDVHRKYTLQNDNQFLIQIQAWH